MLVSIKRITHFILKCIFFKKNDNSFTAFIGSSNTTSWGLEKNVEMNFQVNCDQVECVNLLKWFNEYYDNGYIITEDFFNDYKSKYTRLSTKSKEINNEIAKNKFRDSKRFEQFFTRNEHKFLKKDITE